MASNPPSESKIWLIFGAAFILIGSCRTIQGIFGVIHHVTFYGGSRWPGEHSPITVCVIGSLCLFMGICMVWNWHKKSQRK